MQPSATPVLRYSTAFRRKVVEEIENGTHTIAEAHRIYDIRGSKTIRNWIGKLGKNHLLRKVVRIEMKDESDTLRQQREKIRKLESALSNALLENIVLQSTIAELEAERGTVEKKSAITRSSNERGR